MSKYPQNFEKVKTASGPASEVGQISLYTPKICSTSKPLAQSQRLLTLSLGTGIPPLCCGHTPTHAGYSPSISSLLLCPSLLFLSIPLLPALSLFSLPSLPLCWCYDIGKVAWESEWQENQPAVDTAKPQSHTSRLCLFSLFWRGVVVGEASVCN